MAPTDRLPLWNPVLRKEAMDLLVSLWRDPGVGEPDRERLVAAIVEGPGWAPDDPSDPDEVERTKRVSARAIFERLSLLERESVTPMPRSGIEELGRIRAAYPQWQIDEGEQEHFDAWMEFHRGPEEPDVEGRLESWSPGDLFRRLARIDDDERELILDLWRGAARRRPTRAAAAINLLSRQPGGVPEDLWRPTLWGIGRAIARPAIARRVLGAMAAMGDALPRSSEFVRAAADAMHEATSKRALPLESGVFLGLWDRILDRVLDQPEFAGIDVDGEEGSTTSQALNHPVGHLAQALMSIIFGRGMKVGQGLPPDLRPRFDRLVNTEAESLRLARVILVSRLSYLHAVDAEWARAHLVPGLDWRRSAHEALALWKAFAWIPRMDPDLWAATGDNLLDSLAPERLQRLRDDEARNLVQVLMAVGVELREAEVPDKQVRDALRDMSEKGRSDAVHWLRTYVAGGRKSRSSDDTSTGKEPGSTGPDFRWQSRVKPWLERVWPRQRDCIEPGTSRAFADLAIATEDAFDDAVAYLLPLMTRADEWGMIVNRIADTSHPDEHPGSTLELLNKILSDPTVLSSRKLRNNLVRVAAADDDLRSHRAYRRFDELLVSVGK